MNAMDLQVSASRTRQIDAAIDQASRDIEGLCKRTFYPVDDTKYFDWPNFQRAYPWRIWLDKAELADVTTNVPVITSGGVTIAASHIFWGPWNYAPPYTYLELDRASSESFGHGDTPQREVAITGTFGYWAKTRAAGALDGAISSTTATSITVTNGSLIDGVGVGDVLLVGSERMQVTDKTTAASGQTVQSGLTTAKASDDALGVTTGSDFHVGETLLIGTERLYILDIADNSLTVKRAWGGTTLAAHSASDTIYVYRQLTVTRGDLGTTAATHSDGTAISAYRIPGPVRKLAIAEAINTLQQENAGYSRTIGSGSNQRQAATPADGLDDLRARVYQTYGRKARTRVI